MLVSQVGSPKIYGFFDYPLFSARAVFVGFARAYMFVLVLYPVMSMAKLRLFIRVRKQGSRIESVPVRRLVKLSGCRKRRWEFKDGWLILEGF